MLCQFSTALLARTAASQAAHADPDVATRERGVSDGQHLNAIDTERERRARALWHMKKDQGLRGIRGCHHNEADSTLLMLNETAFPRPSQ